MVAKPIDQLSLIQVFVGLGSNLDKEQQIPLAIAALRQAFGKLVISPIYQSPAVGFEGHDFWNLVVSFETNLSVMQLYDTLKALELSLGRQPNEPSFQNRLIDLDLLLYGDQVIELAAHKLRLPRKDVYLYPFVAKPLADLYPLGIDPL